ncbi:MAG TPA: hypothetical protein VJC18_02185, partial [bacterium]|nr:hypothetical protein [bacterium]
PGTILKRAMSGEFDMMGEIQKVLGELKAGYTIKPLGDWESGTYRDRVNLAKKLAIYACGVAVQKYMADIKDQQYALELMANLVIEVFAMDCAYKRTQQILAKDATQKIPSYLAGIYIAEAYDKMLMIARRLVGEIADGDENLVGKYQKALTRFDLFAPINTNKLRELVATHMVERGGYALK